MGTVLCARCVWSAGAVAVDVGRDGGRIQETAHGPIERDGWHKTELYTWRMRTESSCNANSTSKTDDSPGFLDNSAMRPECESVIVGPDFFPLLLFPCCGTSPLKPEYLLFTRSRSTANDQKLRRILSGEKWRSHIQIQFLYSPTLFAKRNRSTTDN
jgi:hypothetical protein